MLAHRRRNNWLSSIVTGDEDWCLFVNIRRSRHWVDMGEQHEPQPNPGLHSKKVMFAFGGIAKALRLTSRCHAKQRSLRCVPSSTGLTGRQNGREAPGSQHGPITSRQRLPIARVSARSCSIWMGNSTPPVAQQRPCANKLPPFPAVLQSHARKNVR